MAASAVDDFDLEAAVVAPSVDAVDRTTVANSNSAAAATIAGNISLTGKSIFYRVTKVYFRNVVNETMFRFISHVHFYPRYTAEQCSFAVCPPYLLILGVACILELVVNL